MLGVAAAVIGICFILIPCWHSARSGTAQRYGCCRSISHRPATGNQGQGKFLVATDAPRGTGIIAAVVCLECFLVYALAFVGLMISGCFDSSIWLLFYGCALAFCGIFYVAVLNCLAGFLSYLLSTLVFWHFLSIGH